MIKEGFGKDDSAGAEDIRSKNHKWLKIQCIDRSAQISPFPTSHGDMSFAHGTSPAPASESQQNSWVSDPYSVMPRGNADSSNPN